MDYGSSGLKSEKNHSLDYCMGPKEISMGFI
jgi:hypothetical protein